MGLLFLVFDDLKSINDKKKSLIFNFFFSNSFHVICLYRISHLLVQTKLRVFSRLINAYTRVIYSCDIDPKAKIGKGVILMHGFNIVVGENAIIGNNCKIFNGVTLGNRKGTRENGQPKIGDNCLLGTGSKILGNVVIGDNVSIGANAVVLTDIPANSTAVGIPARIINK